MSRKASTVDARVKNAWNRITRWYKAHVQADHFFLEDGASADDITAAETRLGLDFPPELVSSYRLHNGSRGRAVFGYGYPLLPLDEIVEQWGMWQRIVEAGTFDGVEPDCPRTVRKVWWNLKWVPFTHNGGGDHHCIDLDPAETGTVGQVIQFNHEVGARSVLAPDLAAYLERFAGDLEGGNYRFDPDELWLVAVPTKGKKQR